MIDWIKRRFGLKTPNRYTLTDADRTSAKEKKTLKREQEELEHEIKMEKLKSDLKKVRDRSQTEEDLEEKIRDIIEEYLPEDGGGGNSSDIMTFLALMGMKPGQVMNGAAIPAPSSPSPSPVPPTPSVSDAEAEARVPQGAVEGIISHIPEFMLDEIANTDKPYWKAFAGKLWETLNSRKDNK